MLFPSNNCHRSTDPSHVSWIEGRHEPATFPRVTSLQIVSEGFPWVFKIEAGRPEVGITCGDLINGISHCLNMDSSKSDYEALPPVKKRLVKEAYDHNRSRAHGVPGGILDSLMKKLDFLGDTNTLFGGIVNDEDYLNRITEVVLPCTFALMCLPRQKIVTIQIPKQEEDVGNFVMW
ncbi:hypothetical protein BDZ94DRAFT_1256047 [Collybia nuda]|uniref:DUF6699 domain-containing protein n=1 Tax=Collybia nuda TaxID=64659 RepID=A0A9P6CJQ6_9AGAR|nr:hypothetical protein BDZ94DRAFT_1256047 [Collybia nuda]